MKIVAGMVTFALLASAGFGLFFIEPAVQLRARAAPGLLFRPSAIAVGDIPSNYLQLYQDAAAACPGLSWTVLAGIGKIESNHGRSDLPGIHSGQNSAGAMGPMQFLAGTWAAFGQGGNVYDPVDAIPAAARYLCSSGAGDPSKLRDAIWHYNHANWYVDQVMGWAQKYVQVLTSLSGRAASTVKTLTGKIGEMVITDLTPLFGQTWPTSGPNFSFAFGECTWWAARNFPVAWRGDAWQWLGNAAAAGYRISDQPSLGALVVYNRSPTYSGYGHVGNVIAVAHGQYTVSEMNYADGGKVTGTVDQRISAYPDPDVAGFVPRP
jgi:CHAP domain-containing protein